MILYDGRIVIKIEPVVIEYSGPLNSYLGTLMLVCMILIDHDNAYTTVYVVYSRRYRLRGCTVWANLQDSYRPPGNKR
jgi:hypothetical protein